jgi:hypothetical protein
MLNWVGGEVNCTDVVTINDGGSAKGATKLTKQLTQPTCFCNTICHGTILCFSTRAGYCGLALGRPRDEIITKEHSIA